MSSCCATHMTCSSVGICLEAAVASTKSFCCRQMGTAGKCCWQLLAAGIPALPMHLPICVQHPHFVCLTHAAGEGLQGADEVFELQPLASDLSAELAAKYPYLKGCSTLRVPDDVLQQVRKQEGSTCNAFRNTGPQAVKGMLQISPTPALQMFLQHYSLCIVRHLASPPRALHA